MRSCAWSPVKFNCVLSELHDEKPSDEMVTESFFLTNCSKKVKELHFFIPQLFENISAFDIDGEGEVSLTQFK